MIPDRQTAANWTSWDDTFTVRVAVLRATGSAFDAKAFLLAHGLRTNAVWQSGEEFAGRHRREAGLTGQERTVVV